MIKPTISRYLLLLFQFSLYKPVVVIKNKIKNYCEDIVSGKIKKKVMSPLLLTPLWAPPKREWCTSFRTNISFDHYVIDWGHWFPPISATLPILSSSPAMTHILDRIFFFTSFFLKPSFFFLLSSTACTSF